jgi:cell division septation protein DedD
MPIEAALIKPVVDALMALFRQGEHVQLQHHAEAALREAIRELLLANPDENKAAARIAIARAAGILSEDIVLAEDMLQKHRATKARTRGKGTSHKARKPAGAESKAETPAKGGDSVKPAPRTKPAPKPKKKPAAKKRPG